MNNKKNINYLINYFKKQVDKTTNLKKTPRFPTIKG